MHCKTESRHQKQSKTKVVVPSRQWHFRTSRGSKNEILRPCGPVRQRPTATRPILEHSERIPDPFHRLLQCRVSHLLRERDFQPEAVREHMRTYLLDTVLLTLTFLGPAVGSEFANANARTTLPRSMRMTDRRLPPQIFIVYLPGFTLNGGCIHYLPMFV